MARIGAAIAHRGPDAQGSFCQPGVALIHRRLSIIDLTGGDQPIANEDGSVRVIFNGEIYNFRALKATLEQRGHLFRTDSDTEVLVHLYEDHGAALVEKLRGMFAFALWDSRKQQLLLARDRVGIKPLYIYRDAAQLVFGSEIKAILAHPGVERALDPYALDDYLAFGYVPGPRSIFARIEKLSPGHVVTVAPGRLDQSPTCYWRFVIRADEDVSAGDWTEAVRSKLDDAVKSHLVADVPIGAFLSGGLDSSLVVASAVGSGGPVKTFSIGFDDPSFDELPYARAVAERYGIEHIEAVVRPDAVSLLEELSCFYDEPFADSSAIPTFLVSRLAAQHVKVVLSGDGGDEAFGGYTRYAHDLMEGALRGWLPNWAQRFALQPLAKAWPRTDWLPRRLRLKSALTNLSLDPARAYANTLSSCAAAVRKELMTPELVSRLDSYYEPEEIVRSSYAKARGKDTLAAMLEVDVAMLLPDDFLVKVDRASMANGLEVRPPFLDHELLELAARIPSKWKVRKGETKWVLKQAAASRLPPQTVWRRKHGFEMPVDQWLREPLREFFNATVLSRHAAVAGVINQGTAAKLFHQHVAGTHRHGSVLWVLLVLSRWMERYRPTT
jgi:asparagine synthase (glutamine-hydrolysing)